jgi:hypothetical protein
VGTEDDRNVGGLRQRLASLPNLGALVVPEDVELRTLARAWQFGAMERSEPAPFIELIFAERHEARLVELETGLPGLGLSSAEAEYFRGRIAQDKRGGHAPGVAALGELMVGVRLKNAGAAVRFVEVGKGRGVRTPDIEASRDTTSVTIEVTSFHEADQAKAEADADHSAFMSWTTGSPVPERLIGRARSPGPGIRFLESVGQPLGPGTIADRAHRLALKLREKADRGQLAARPNPVLVVDCWHVWGIHATAFDPSKPGEPDSPYRAAVYGRMGETVTDGVLFHGEPLQTWPLGIDGVLTVPGDAAALLWVFQSGRALLTKRGPGAVPPLDARAERLLIDAFDPIVMAP